jgi:2-dehydro-3-deoxyphosphogluconate aldolase / (4S)-4-hydroxy-2-oxoglutarate aldolase
VPLIAAGGVNQQTVSTFIQVGASAVGIGSELLPREALQLRKEQQIRELARRFLAMVKNARNHKAGQS